ncbi:MAG: ATP-binding protein [Trebonia sp.]
MSSDLDLLTDVPAAGQWFGPGLDAPAAARRFARDFVACAGADQYCQEVTELLVSELVTNAIVHAGSTARLWVRAEDGSVRVQVGDDGPGEPRVRLPGNEGGCGMWLVDNLAWAWGVTKRDGDQVGKTIWFTLPLAAVPGP